jgi:protein disulfide-isomerase
MPSQVTNPYANVTSAAPSQQSPLVGPAQPNQPTFSAGIGSTATLGSAYGQVAPPQSQAAAATTPSAAAPDVRQLPPGSPPLGFEGYCPVSMRTSWKWVAGDPRFGIVHRGRTYWFASQSEQQQFWTDPDRYTPALSGMDPVLAIDHKQEVPGRREHSIDYDGLFYMFSSEATLSQFTANPQKYAASVRQAMGIPRGRLVR